MCDSCQVSQPVSTVAGMQGGEHASLELVSGQPGMRIMAARRRDLALGCIAAGHVVSIALPL